MKLKLHSQSQSRDLILHFLCKQLRLKLLFLLLFFPPLYVSFHSWRINLCWMCAQYFPMVINPLSRCKELGRKLLISPTDTAVALSQTKELLPLTLYLALSTHFSFFLLSVCPNHFYHLHFSPSWTLVCSSGLFCSMQLTETPVLVLRCVSSACLCAGHQNCLFGAQHSRSGGWDPDAEGKQFTEHGGSRGRDQTDGGLQEPLKVYEDEGRVSRRRACV